MSCVLPCPGHFASCGRATQGVRVMNVADNDRVTAVAIASSGKKKRAKSADGEVSDDQMELLEEESQEGTLSEDDIDE